MTENMRREARFDVRMPVEIFRGKIAHSYETTDVSFKGMFIEAASPPPLRSLVRLRVTLPGRSFEAHAMVVHVVELGESERRPGMGLQFWGLSGPDRSAWDEFVRARAPKKASIAPPPGSPSSFLILETPSGVRPMTPAAAAEQKQSGTTPVTSYFGVRRAKNT